MTNRKNVTGYLTVFRVMEKLARVMEARGISRADLARRLEVQPPAVTRWFSPGRNLTIFTAAAIADALGSELRIEVVDKGSETRRTPQVQSRIPFTVVDEPSLGVAVHGTASFARTRGGRAPRVRAKGFSLDESWAST